LYCLIFRLVILTEQRAESGARSFAPKASTFLITEESFGLKALIFPQKGGNSALNASTFALKVHLLNAFHAKTHFTVGREFR
jgi:hypothetical protein